MKQYISILLMLFMTMAVTGCGGAGPEEDADATTDAETLEESTDYEKEMMGEMGGDAGK
jgi:predicted small lipoprotein YifL